MLGQRALNRLLLDRDGQRHEFRVASNDGESSSIFPFARHREIWPAVDEVRSIFLQGSTLASALREEAIDIGAYQALILDTQGSELLVLKGAQGLLRNFRHIEVEAADFEAYAGAPMASDVEAFLATHGFSETRRVAQASKAGVGSYFDILFSSETAAGAAPIQP